MVTSKWLSGFPGHIFVILFYLPGQPLREASEASGWVPHMWVEVKVGFIYIAPQLPHMPPQ